MKNMKKKIIRLVCKHEVAEDRGPVQLWNGETRMLEQCAFCGALFINGYDMYTELPDMRSKWDKAKNK